IKNVLHPNLHSPAVVGVAKDIKGMVNELRHTLRILVARKFIDGLVVGVHTVLGIHHKWFHGCTGSTLLQSPLTTDEIAEVEYVEVELYAVYLLAHLHLHLLSESHVETVIPWVECSECLCIFTLVLAQIWILVDKVPECFLLVIYGKCGVVGGIFHKVHLVLRLGDVDEVV